MSKYRSGAVKDTTYSYSSSGSRTDSDDETRTEGRTLSSLSGKNRRKPSPYKDPVHVQGLNKAQLLKKAKGNIVIQNQNTNQNERLPARKPP